MTNGFQAILEDKRRKVAWKLQSVRKAFDASIASQLQERRRAMNLLGSWTTPTAQAKIE